jgi:hypothetical protein
VTPIACNFIACEIGMNGLGDVAKQLADGIARESRLRLRTCGGRERLGSAGLGDTLRHFAQLRFGELELEAIELVVEQSDLGAVSNPERGQVGLRLRGIGAAFAEH